MDETSSGEPRRTPLSRRLPGWTPYAALLSLWGGALLGLGLLRAEPYGLDEAGARALLLNWTVLDRVVNPIVILGAPDLRALLFLPLGIYWPGSLLAVRVFTALAAFAAAVLLHRWLRHTEGEEAARLATGLLLIAPLTIGQIDAVGSGPYLLLCFALGPWLLERYAVKRRPLGGWFMLQMLTAMVAVSLHPAGLAYPLALAWEWHRRPLEPRHRRHYFIGLAAATLVILLMRLGWPGLAWLGDPLEALKGVLLGQIPGYTEMASAAWGVVPAALTVALLVLDRQRIREDLLARTLALGLILGALAADLAWAYLALAWILARGLPWLVRLNERFPGQGLLARRGLVLAALVGMAVLFTAGDRALRAVHLAGTLSDADQAIKALALALEGRQEETRILSQWPARTMLATRHPSFPLPPALEEPEALLETVRRAQAGYLLFDPRDPDNRELARAVSVLSAQMKTVELWPRAVVVEIVQDEEGKGEPSAGSGGTSSSSAGLGGHSG